MSQMFEQSKIIYPSISAFSKIGSNSNPIREHKRSQQACITVDSGAALCSANRIRGFHEPILERGNQMDRLFWIVLSEHLRHTG